MFMVHIRREKRERDTERGLTTAEIEQNEHNTRKFKLKNFVRLNAIRNTRRRNEYMKRNMRKL